MATKKLNAEKQDVEEAMRGKYSNFETYFAYKRPKQGVIQRLPILVGTINQESKLRYVLKQGWNSEDLAKILASSRSDTDLSRIYVSWHEDLLYHREDSQQGYYEAFQIHAINKGNRDKFRQFCCYDAKVLPAVEKHLLDLALDRDAKYDWFVCELILHQRLTPQGECQLKDSDEDDLWRFYCAHHKVSFWTRSLRFWRRLFSYNKEIT